MPFLTRTTPVSKLKHFLSGFFSSVPISSSNRMFERDLHFASVVHCDCSITVALEANTLAQNTTLKHPHS